LLFLGIFVLLWNICKWVCLFFWNMGKLSVSADVIDWKYYLKVVGMSILYFYIFCLFTFYGIRLIL
jgi:hypothetical protein